MIIRDRAYLDWLKTQPCIITGYVGTGMDVVDPSHIGTAGKGLKSDDSEALPLSHRLHMEGHQHGEMTMWRKNIPDWLLREVLRSYAREFYRKYKEENL